MIYLLCFGTSALFAQFAKKSKYKFWFLVFSVVSIMVPTILAGLRDYSIGIDVKNYIIDSKYWQGASVADSLWEYIKNIFTSDKIEPLFGLFIGVIEKITGNFRVFLTLSHLVIMTGIYIGAFRQKDYVDPVLVIILFYLIFFNHSLNIIRQYMAMAIIFAFLKDIELKRYFRFGVVVIIATLIHSTAVLAFGTIVIHLILYADYKIGGIKIGKHTIGNPYSPDITARKRFIVYAIGSGVIVFLPLCRILLDMGILGKRYKYFLTGKGVSYALIVTALLVFELSFVFLFRKQMKKKSSYSDFFIISSVTYLLLQQLTGSIVFGKRIAAYYAFHNLLTIGLLDKSFEDKRRIIKWSVRISIILVALAYWGYVYVLRNASHTYPYVLGLILP